MQWVVTDGEGRRTVVELDFDERSPEFKKLVAALGRKAAHSRTGTASIGFGAIKARVVAREDPRQSKLPFPK